MGKLKARFGKEGIIMKKNILLLLVGMMVFMSTSALATTITIDLDNASIEELKLIQSMIEDRISTIETVEEETEMSLEEQAFGSLILNREYHVPLLKEGIPYMQKQFKNPYSVKILGGTFRSDSDGGATYILDIMAENSMGGTTRKEYALEYDGKGNWDISDDTIVIAYARMMSGDFDEITIEWLNYLLK